VTLGLLLIIGCGFGSVLLQMNALKKTTVWATRQELPAGARLSATDIAAVKVVLDQRLRPFAVTSGTSVVGQALRVGVTKGTILTQRHLSREPEIPAGESVVAIPLRFGQTPTVEPNDSIVVVAPSAQLVAVGKVWAVDKAANTDDVRVSILTDDASAGKVAFVVASAGQVSLTVRGTGS